MPRKRTPEEIENVRSTVQSVDRALGILETLADIRKEISVGDLATRVNLHISTTHRLLSALMARGYVRQNPNTGKYSLGLKALEVGNAVHYQRDLRTEGQSTLLRLAEETGETTNIAVLDQGQAVYVDQVESDKTVRMFVKIGARVPVHCSAVGKVLIAYLSDQEIEQMVKQRGMARFTDNTITEVEGLRTELEIVRRQGFAIDNAEREPGVRCVAAPIFDAANRVVAAISISGPSLRVSETNVNDLAEQARVAGLEVSSRLGRPETY
jgi:IclR family transcriptional regulator, KDG regulon repressor